MEFLYKLYSNNYFGIGLFAIITVLAFAFLIILFFGKKDEKKRISTENENDKFVKEEKLEKVEIIQENLEPILVNEETAIQGTTNLEPISLDETISLDTTYIEPTIEEAENFEKKEKEEIDPFDANHIVLSTDSIAEKTVPKVESIPTNPILENSNIYNLDSIINEEEVSVSDESIDDVLNKYDTIEETILNASSEIMDLPKEEMQPIAEENDFKIFEKPNEILKSSKPFSSVYLTKEEAPTQTEEKIETPVEPSRPTFEMPKKMELPKKSSGAINENIISSFKDKNL